MEFKYILHLLFTTIAMSLSMAAVGLTFESFDIDVQERACGKGKIRAMGGFAIMTVIVAALGFILAIVSLFKPLKVVNMVFALIITVFSIVPWAIAADLWETKNQVVISGSTVTISNCGLKKFSSPFLPLFLACTVCAIVAFAVLVIMEDAAAPADSEPAQDEKKPAAEESTEMSSANAKKTEESESREPTAAAEPKKKDETTSATVAAAATTEQKSKKEEDKKPAVAAADEKKKSKPVINWKEINAKLPYDKKNMAQKQRRFEMFDKIDTNKTGQVSLAEVTAGMETVIGLGDQIDVPLVIKTAFDKAKVAGQQGAASTDAAGGDTIEKNEFRLFLMYTRMYFEMFQLFSELDETGDMRIELGEFEKSIPLLKTWGAKIDDAAETFKQIDKNGGGKVLFGEFVDWALSPEQNLDCPDEDE